MGGGGVDPFLRILHGLRARHPPYADFQALCIDPYVLTLGRRLVLRTKLCAAVNGPYTIRTTTPFAVFDTGTAGPKEFEVPDAAGKLALLIVSAFRAAMYPRESFERGINTRLTGEVLRRAARLVDFIAQLVLQAENNNNNKDDDDSSGSSSSDDSQQQGAARTTTMGKRDAWEKAPGKLAEFAKRVHAMQEARDAWVHADVAHIVCRQVETLEGFRLTHGGFPPEHTEIGARMRTMKERLHEMRKCIWTMRGREAGDALLRHTMLIRRVRRLRTHLLQTERRYVQMLLAWPRDGMRDELEETEGELTQVRLMLQAKGLDPDALLAEGNAEETDACDAAPPDEGKKKRGGGQEPPAVYFGDDGIAKSVMALSAQCETRPIPIQKWFAPGTYLDAAQIAQADSYFLF